MTCQELVEVVTDYFEGVLPPADVARFDAHLADCPHCRVYLEQMRQTIRTLGCLPEESIPDRVKDDLLDRFRTWKATP